MGTSEVHLPEGENLIGFFSERSFTSFLFFIMYLLVILYQIHLFEFPNP